MGQPWPHAKRWLSLGRPAEASGLNVIGTLGTLVAAKRAGLLKSIRPELDGLRATSFFLSQQLYDELLQAAGEVDS
jgi:predicted nucleic acid-binding protein